MPASAALSYIAIKYINTIRGLMPDSAMATWTRVLSIGSGSIAYVCISATMVEIPYVKLVPSREQSLSSGILCKSVSILFSNFLSPKMQSSIHVAEKLRKERIFSTNSAEGEKNLSSLIGCQKT